MKNAVIILQVEHQNNEMKYEVGNTPHVLYTFGGKTVLERTIQAYENIYKDENEYFIALDYGIQELEEYLNNELIEYRINIIELTEDLSPADRLNKVHRRINANKFDNFFINFSDTVPVESDIDSIHPNVVYFTEKSNPFNYVKFELFEGLVNKISKKTSGLSEKVFVGLSKLSRNNFLQIFTNDFKQDTLEDYYTNILKIGNYALKAFQGISDLRLLNEYVRAKESNTNKRFFNDVEIDSYKGTFTKKSKNTDKFIGEISWYINLPEELKNFIPRIYEYSLNPDNPFVKMEYYSYPSLSEVLLYRNYGLGTWNHIIDSLLKLLKHLKNHQIVYAEESVMKFRKQIYLTKTNDRLSELRDNRRFSNYFENPITINGITYPSLNQIIEILPSIYNNKFNTFENFSVIHGDYCLSNILYSPRSGTVKMVDPRGEFGCKGIYGDSLYDYAKLMHSFSGLYEYIIHEKFRLNYQSNNNSIDYKFLQSVEQGLIGKLFKSKIGDNLSSDDLTRVEFIEACLFLSMVPLHADYPERQIVMMAQGVEKISKFIN